MQILQLDDWLIVVNKPSGLLSQPGLGPQQHDSLLTRLRVVHPQARIVHRLDRDASGVMVLALDAATHGELSRQFREREVSKRYVAVVAGHVAEAGEIDLPLTKDFDQPPRHKVDHRHGKPSTTRWRRLECGADWTRLELIPLTGRSHQLRVHLAATGHAILGDPLYGDDTTRSRASRLLLHATELTFQHPASSQPMTIESVCEF